MGNTQHSLLSGALGKVQNERGKTQSPETKSGRHLMTSKSPARIADKTAIWYSSLGGNTNPSKNQSHFLGQTAHQEAQVTSPNQKLSSSLKTKLKTVIGSSQGTPIKDNSQPIVKVSG
jgi:hypothetical protein